MSSLDEWPIFNIEHLRQLLTEAQGDMHDTSTAEFLKVAPFLLNELQRLQQRNIDNINRNLELMLNDKLEDGTPVLEVVFAQSPELKTRLISALKTFFGEDDQAEEMKQSSYDRHDR